MNQRIALLREAITKITQVLAGKGIKVTQRGLTAGVKRNAKGAPIEVNLPYLPDNCPEDLISAIQGFLDKEVAHLLFTNFDVATKAKKKGVSELFDIIEGIQVEKSMARRFNGSGHNVASMRQFFINKFLNYEVKKLEASTEEKDKTALSKLLIAPAFRSFAGQTEFTDFMTDRDLMKYVKPVVDRLGPLLSEVGDIKSSEESLDLAVRMQEELKKASGGTGKGDEEQEGGEATNQSNQTKGKGKGKGEKSDGSDGDTMGDEKNPDGEGSGADGGDEGDANPSEGDSDDSGDEEGDGGGQGDSGDDEGEPSDGKTASGGGDDDGDESDEGETDKQEAAGSSGEPVEYSEQENPNQKSGNSKQDEGTSSKGAFVENITDDLSAMISAGKNMGEVVAHIASTETANAAAASDYVPYTRDYDKIERLDLEDGHSSYNDSMLANVENKTAHMVAPLQKDLERAIAARSQSQWQPGQRRGRLHAGNLTRLITGDDRVFRKREISDSKDTAVTLLVDCSGSMQGNKMETASMAAFALSQVLERIGIAHEVLGFTTGSVQNGVYQASEKEENGVASNVGNRNFSFARLEPIIMPVMKDFDDRLTLEAKRRIAFLPYWGKYGANIDGESIQIAHSRLLRRKEHRKIIIVLSDGSPAGGNGRLVYDHLKKVVEDIEASPTSIIGIGIQTDSVKKFYKNNVVISDVSDLPGKVMGELKKMLMSEKK